VAVVAVADDILFVTSAKGGPRCWLVMAVLARSPADRDLCLRFVVGSATARKRTALHASAEVATVANALSW
jgi:hypothetical protein